MATRKNKKIAIIQSNYIPWKGYFDIMNLVEEFIILDEVQYTRRDWRNRNLIKTPRGAQWLTIPVEVKGKYLQKINETVISDSAWGKKHWTTLSTHYRTAKHFKTYRPFFEELYHTCNEKRLSDINYRFITAINSLLEIKTKLFWSDHYSASTDKTANLIRLCKETHATEYLSGPTAKGYIDEQLFRQENIILTWMDYSDYPEYNQLYPPFDHHVSIIDLLLCEGPNAPHFMKSFGG